MLAVNTFVKTSLVLQQFAGLGEPALKFQISNLKSSLFSVPFPLPILPFPLPHIFAIHVLANSPLIFSQFLSRRLLSFS